MLQKISAEEMLEKQKAIIREYREQRVNMNDSDRQKARDRAIYQLGRLGMTSGHALAELEGKRKG